jgi:hypothetical protein
MKVQYREAAVGEKSRIGWTRERLTGYDPLEAGPAAVFRTVATIDQWTYRDDYLCLLARHIFSRFSR